MGRKGKHFKVKNKHEEKQQSSTQQISCWKFSLSAHAFNPKSLCRFQNGFSKPKWSKHEKQGRFQAENGVMF